MKKQYLTCIGCPVGCYLSVTTQGHTVKAVCGNKCKRGVTYAQHEVVSPTRTLTTTLQVHEGVRRTVAVKTESEIPKKDLFACVKAIKNAYLTAPIHCGDVLVSNVAGTGVSLIATSSVDAS